MIGDTEQGKKGRALNHSSGGRAKVQSSNQLLQGLAVWAALF